MHGGDSEQRGHQENTKMQNTWQEVGSVRADRPAERQQLQGGQLPGPAASCGVGVGAGARGWHRVGVGARGSVRGSAGSADAGSAPRGHERGTDPEG